LAAGFGLVKVAKRVAVLAHANAACAAFVVETKEMTEMKVFVEVEPGVAGSVAYRAVDIGHMYATVVFAVTVAVAVAAAAAD
jgi:hypothetical protein